MVLSYADTKFFIDFVNTDKNQYTIAKENNVPYHAVNSVIYKLVLYPEKQIEIFGKILLTLEKYKEKKGGIKINNKLASEIRLLFNNGTSIIKIAKKFNLHSSTVRKIVRNKMWKIPSEGS